MNDLKGAWKHGSLFPPVRDPEKDVQVLLTILRKVRPYLDNFAGIQEEVDKVLEPYKGE